MAQAQNNSKNNKVNGSINAGGVGEAKPTTFHDFLGNKGKGQEPTPAPSGGGRPPQEFSPSAPSDQGSERHVSNHLEGIPFYGSRGDLTGPEANYRFSGDKPEASYRFSGDKRSNSDSLMVSSRDKFRQGQADPQDNRGLTKLMRYSGGERPRQPHDEEPSFGMQQMRPISASFISQSSIGGRTDASNSKWDRAIPVNLGPVLQYPSRAAQVTPFSYQAPSSRIKDMNVGPVISQTAADEGSRTGIKGSGILSSTNTIGGISGRQPSEVLVRSGKQKSGVCISEPEFSTTPSQRGTESAGRQMTIFYGGQAHVFDNIHPNKADVIMALAGSNGGSWSTIYTPDSVARASAEDNRMPSSENDAGIAIPRELHARSSDKVESYHALGSGSYQGGISIKEKNPSFKEAKIGAGGKPEE